MNSVDLVGRLVRDPEVKYTGDQMCVATFTLAIRRDKDNADFPRVKVFGKQAEAIEKYIRKGRMLAVHGRVATGSYKKENGETVYTTDIVASQIDFVDSAPKQEEKKPEQRQVDFAALDEDVPF